MAWRSGMPGWWWPAAVAAAALLVAGCTGEPEPPSLRSGDHYASWWAPRGSLAGDGDVRAEVAGVVADWRTPDGAGSHDEATALLWLGEVDGVVLGVVDFRPADDPDDGWRLEVTGEPGHLSVTDARDHDGPVAGEDILPVRSPQVGPRYLVSGRVSRLTGADGQQLPLHDGLTGRVEVPACRVTGLSVQGSGVDQRRLDLGRDIAAPYYPLLAEGYYGVPAAPLLGGVDTCAAMAPGGWLAAVGQADGQPATTIGGYPVLLRLGAAAPADVQPGAPPGELAAVQAEYASTSGGVRLAEWLVWTHPAGDGEITDVATPAGAEVLAREPGLVVMRLPAEPVEITYVRGGDDHQLTVTPP